MSNKIIPCEWCHGTGVVSLISTTTGNRAYVSCANCGGRGNVTVWLSADNKVDSPYLPDRPTTKEGA